MRFLDRFIADQNQYLVISFKDGHKDHVQGPASLFLDPVVHKSISVEAAVRRDVHTSMHYFMYPT